MGIGRKDRDRIGSYPSARNGRTGNGLISEDSRRENGQNTSIASSYLGLSENSVPLHPMVNDHYPY